MESASLNSDAGAGAGGDGMGSEDVCLMGEVDGFLGDDMIVAVDKVGPASRFFEVRRMLSSLQPQVADFSDGFTIALGCGCGGGEAVGVADIEVPGQRERVGM